MKRKAILLLQACLVVSLSQAQDISDFENPSNEAKPRVWWHWMNGNVTKDGIKKDLEWMEATGIGGFQNFDANLMTPSVVNPKLVYMTPEWKEAFKYTTDLASEKGLEMAIAGSPGWSVTGGPWVKPEDGMKKITWSLTQLSGGRKVSMELPLPPAATGAYLDANKTEESILGSNEKKEVPEYYQDAYIIAYKLPEREKNMMLLSPKITLSGGDFDTGFLTDGKLNEYHELPAMEVGEDMFIQYAFDSPQTFKAFAVAGSADDPLAQFNGVPLNRSLKVSDDGVNFREIVKLSGSYVPLNTVAIPPTTAKYWRMCFETLEPTVNPMLAMMGMGPGKPKGTKVAEFILFNTARIDQIEDKAGFSPWTEVGLVDGYANEESILSEDVIDLTTNFSNGFLNWEAPEGTWEVMRLGYSLTGRENHPASPEATGLEVDKLDEDAVRRYINNYLDQYKDATGDQLGANGLGFMILDSYEAGHMNWTHDFADEFESRRGYPIAKWTPVLTGRVVNSTAESEKFLWDFRKTIGEMIVENHYEVIGEELHKRGMKRYTESHENKRIFLADGMDVKKKADIPMSAMWTPGSLAPGPDEEVRSEADIREAASVAHIFGKPYVAAESMTSVRKSFQEHPEVLKRTADLELASGLNRFVIHTSVHQPLDKGPGFSLGPFGQYFSRLETWSGAGAQAWIGYLGRSSYMMQQGKNVADILYYYGENTNITWVCRESLPTLPNGLEFDFVNASILKENISSENGLLVAPSGVEYKALILDESAKEMTLPVLQKIAELQKAGVKIAGTAPEFSPSLSDDRQEFKKLAASVAEKMVKLEDLGLNPDVTFEGTSNEILFRHRKSDQKDIYWLNNRSHESTTAITSFNVSGKVPKLWNAEDGSVKMLSYSIKNGRTEVPITFDPWGAYFIVFEGESSTDNFYVESLKVVDEKEIEGIWQVEFDGETHEMEELVSWTESESTKHFSGTAIYRISFDQSKAIKKGESYVLEIESLNNLAEVKLNGKSLGVIWHKPYKIDLTTAIKKGENQLEIHVTNSWVNRLVGDASKKRDENETFTTMPFYRENSPLEDSGIIGSVILKKKM